MRKLEVIEVPVGSAEAEAWRRTDAFAAIDGHPYSGAFGRAYYPKTVEPEPERAGLAVMEGARPLLYVPALVSNGHFAWLSAPARPFPAAWVEAPSLAAAFAALVRALERMIEEGRLASWELADLPLAAEASPLALEALARRAVPRLWFRAEHDLQREEGAMRASIRNSYRSMINWGRKHLRIVTIDAANPDAEGFAAYRSFHQAIAGRVTRPAASWEAMFAHIASGRGELQLGHLDDGRLVSALMVVDGTEAAAYASGVFERELFELPLAHWPLWNAILRARQRGMKVFDLGDIPPPGSGTAKEAGIALFKRGFASRLVHALSWHRGGGEEAS